MVRASSLQLQSCKRSLLLLARNVAHAPPCSTRIAPYSEHTLGKHLLIFSLFFAALTAGCGAKAPPPLVEAGPAALPLNTFMKKWTANVDANAGGILQVYVREDLIFAYAANGTSYVISRETGRLLHADPIPGGIATLHPPVLMKDIIIYTSLNALQIYDRRSGLFVRTAPLPFAVRSGAVGYKGELFLCADFAGGGRLVCLDITHEFVPVRWSLMFPSVSASSTPVVLSDVVYAAGEDGRVAAVSVENREPAWGFGFFQTNGPIYGDLQIDENGLYVASYDSKLYCLNRTTGKVKWQYFAGVGLKATPALTKDLVLESVPGVGLVALDKAAPVVEAGKGPQYDRQPRWIAADATQFLAEDNAYVYVARNDQSIAAIDKTTGTRAFVSKQNYFSAWAINNKDGIIFAGTADNRVMAIQSVGTSGTVGQIVRADSADQHGLQLAQAAN